MCIHSRCALWTARMSHCICSMCLLHRTVDAGHSNGHVHSKTHCSLNCALRHHQSLGKVTIVVRRFLLPPSSCGPVHTKATPRDTASLHTACNTKELEKKSRVHYYAHDTGCYLDTTATRSPMPLETQHKTPEWTVGTFAMLRTDGDDDRGQSLCCHQTLGDAALSTTVQIITVTHCLG